LSKNGSFSDAARALEVPQTIAPAGCPRSAADAFAGRFTPRRAFGICATPAAAEFARRVKLAEREIDLGLDELDTARGNVGGEIVIGAMRVAGSVLLASVINEFASSYPNSNIRIVTGRTKEMMRYLRCGDVDAVIGLLKDSDFGRPGAGTARRDTLRGRGATRTSSAATGKCDARRSCAVRVGHRQLPRAVAESVSTACLRVTAGRPPGSKPVRCRPFDCCSRKANRLTLLTSYELMYEEDALTSVPFGPIEPVPSIGLTMRENWLPTQRQASFIDLIQKRIVRFLKPGKEPQRSAQQRFPRNGIPAVAAP